MTKKTVEQKFRKLDEISHVLLRPGRYIGSITPHTATTWMYDLQTKKMTQREVSWTPALIKIFDEIISNSVDFSKTTEGKHLDTIAVTLNQLTGEITVTDNGGIVVHKHKEYDQYIPEMIFELRSGSNFDDDHDSFVAGQNGEGSALTAIFSHEFEVQTADGTNKFTQTRTDNSRAITTPKIVPSTKHFTTIRFIPDYARFGLSGLDNGNFDKLTKRVVDVAGCNPNLKVTLNGERIKINSFNDYVALYSDDFISEENDNWKVAIASSDGFEHVSFVNGTETTIGGNHIGYISDQIVSKLREHFKKKHKVDIKPSDIKNHFKLFINATILRPRYSSQTKEDLITEVKNFATSIELSDKFISKVLKSTVIQSVLDWVNAKEAALAAADLRKKNNEVDKTNLRGITKFTDASEKIRREDCMLMVCEGDSAKNSILSARTSLIGCYPLRGKLMNAMSVSVAELTKNKEIFELMAVMGLKVGQKVKSPKDTRFGKLVIVTDADQDGNSIAGLIVALIRKYWPEMFSLGMVYRFQTPIIKIESGKENLYFDTLELFNNWVNQNPKKRFVSRYLKGLGSSQAADFKKYFSDMDKNLIQLTINSELDFDVVDMVYSKDSGSADVRKKWLNLE